MEELDSILKQAIKSKAESDRVDFKESFDPNSTQSWCELIKDIVAMANSGGGALIVGIKDDGTPSDTDIKGLIQIDSAKIVDKIAKYTGIQFADFQITSMFKNGHEVAILQISAVRYPLVFAKTGNYSTGKDGRNQKNAFCQGTVYCRHGAKSEPATTDDLRVMIDNIVEEKRKLWMDNIRKVTEAPQDAIVSVITTDQQMSNLDQCDTFRISDCPTAKEIKLNEATILELYPLDNAKLVKILRSRYTDFKKDTKFHQLKRIFEGSPRLCHERVLDPGNPKSARKKYFSNEVIAEFDKYYMPKNKAS